MARPSAPNPDHPSPRPVPAAVRWAARAALALVLVTGAVAAAALLVQVASDARARRSHRPPGLLVDVGGHRLHLLCVGEGSPTVVLEYGLLAHSLQWGWIQPEVARTTRVCAYDRAGYGFSDPGPGDRTAAVEANELHTLLHRANVPGPYVLVGHSYGAYVVRAYAARHLSEVAGMVLVDGSHPSQFDAAVCEPTCLPPEIHDDVDPAYRFAPTLARFAGFRLFRLFQGDRTGLFEWVKTLPADARPALVDALYSTRHWKVGAAEWALWSVSAGQARALVSLGDRPLRVVTAGATYVEKDAARFMPPGLDGRDVYVTWNRLQLDLLRLSSASAQILVPEANHVSLATERAHARHVVAAIEEVVAAARLRAATAWR